MADLAEQHVISDHERRTNSGNLVAETQSILLEGAAVLTQKTRFSLPIPATETEDLKWLKESLLHLKTGAERIIEQHEAEGFDAIVTLKARRGPKPWE